MRKSKFLAKIRDNKVARVCSLGHFVPAYVRHAAHFNYDAIWLDLEHRCMAANDVRALLALAQQFDIDCIVRPTTLDNIQLYRYLEDGATGLIIPNVATAQQAQAMVDAAKFPPIGNRGLDGSGLDNDFNLANSNDYPAHANHETVLLLQIESPEAIDNIDEITAIAGVDGLMMGPADLGLRLQHAATKLTLDEAVSRVAETTGRYDKFWGYPCSAKEDVRKQLEMGAQFLNYGSDFWAFRQGLEMYSSELDEILN